MVTFILILIAIILIPIAFRVIIEAWPIFLILVSFGFILLLILLAFVFPQTIGMVLIIGLATVGLSTIKKPQEKLSKINGHEFTNPERNEKVEKEEPWVNDIITGKF